MSTYTSVLLKNSVLYASAHHDSIYDLLVSIICASYLLKENRKVFYVLSKLF